MDESARIGEMTPEQRKAHIDETNKKYEQGVIAADAEDLRKRLREKTEGRKTEIDAALAAIEKEFAGVDPVAAPLMAAAAQEATARKWRLKVEKAAIEGDGTDDVRALRMQLFEAEQRLRLFDAKPLPAPGGMVPRRAADADDRAAARQAHIDQPPLPMRRPPGRNAPLPLPSPLRDQLPPVGDDAGGMGGPVKAVVGGPVTAEVRDEAGGMAGPVKAVVEGPVTAEVRGEAQIKVQVDVTAAPELKALARAADSLLKLRSDGSRSNTGRSMTEAEPPTGRSGW